MSHISSLFEVLEKLGEKGPEYREIMTKVGYSLAKDIIKDRKKKTEYREIEAVDIGTQGLREILITIEELAKCGHDTEWIIQFVSEKYHPTEVAAELEKMDREKGRSKKEPFPKVPHPEMPSFGNIVLLENHRSHLIEMGTLSKLVKKKMEKYELNFEIIKNICGMEAHTLQFILDDIMFPNNYDIIPLAKLMALLDIRVDQCTEPFVRTHSVVMIDIINEARGQSDELPDLEAWKNRMTQERKKFDDFIEPFYRSLYTLHRQGFHQNSIRQLKKEQHKEEIARNKASQVPVIKDIIKDKLVTVAPEAIAGKTTDEYLNEVQRLRERLSTYGTFAQHFKKALETIKYEAPALERRFGFKKAHTLALSIDELYPYELDIKTFVPVCKFLKFVPQTLIPQLENTFLLLQLKKMGEGTTKEKLEKLSALSAGEKRKWEDDKNRLEAWIRRLTPVITRELSPNNK